MLHGRLPTRWRTLIRWTLFVLLLAGAGVILDLVLPSVPRWVQPGLLLVGISPDGRSVVTTKYSGTPEDGLRGNGPLQVWDLATGQESARYFDDDSFMFPTGFARSLDDTLVVPMQRGLKREPEIHLLDLARGATHKLPLTLHRKKTPSVYLSPRFPFAVIHQAAVTDDAEKDADVCLVDLKTNEVLQQWNHVEVTCYPIFHEHLVFFGYRSAAKATAVFWNIKTRQVKSETDARGGIYVNETVRIAATTYLLEPNRQKVTLWDLTTGMALSETVTEEGSIQLLNDGHGVIVCKMEPGARASYWNLRDSRQIGEWPHHFGDWHSAFSDNGQNRLLTISPKNGTVRLLEAETLKTVWKRTWPNSPELELVVWQPQARRLAIHPYFENGFEYLSLSDGKTVERVSFVGSRWRNRNIFHSEVSQDGRWLSVMADYVEDDTQVLNRCLTTMKSLWLPEGPQGLASVTVIDLETGAAAFQWRGYSSLHHWQFSDDRRTGLIVHSKDGSEPILECWDIHARRPWLSIVGLPLGFGVVAISLRWAWLKRRGA